MLRPTLRGRGVLPCFPVTASMPPLARKKMNSPISEGVRNASAGDKRERVGCIFPEISAEIAISSSLAAIRSRRSRGQPQWQES